MNKKEVNQTVMLQEKRPEVVGNILETIGHTPLIHLNKVVSEKVEADVYAKAEYFNPAGSIKDRIGLSIIEDAEREGRLLPGGTIVEATSGNTGAGLALVASVKGYKCVFVMPDKMSDEKVRLLRAFGARVVITPTAVPPEDPRSYYNVAARIVRETPNSILANQYHNPANPDAHYHLTGPEIWEQMDGKVDALVAGMGTGGTISGVARFLKEKNPDVKIVAVDILGSLLYDAWKLGRVPNDSHPKTYKIEGIGEDFLPSTLDLSLIDEVVQVDDRESFQMTRRLVREEGIFAGGSSGSAVAGLLKSKIVRSFKPDQNVVVILPDSGNRYLSKIFDDNWMGENGFMPVAKITDSIALLLETSHKIPLVVTRPDEEISAVVDKMNRYDISQLPVVDEGSRLIGLVAEADILDHLLHANHVRDPLEAIAKIVNPKVPAASIDESIESILPIFKKSEVVVVVNVTNQPVGMITKIDLIEYLTHKGD